MSTLADLGDALLVVMKRDCETCQMVSPLVVDLARAGRIVIASQDDPSFPDGVEVIDDTDLNLSWELQTEVTPTLYRIRSGRIDEEVAGWDRWGWRKLIGDGELGSDLPEQRPGCGSRLFEPGVYEMVRSRRLTLRSRRWVVSEREDPFELMYAKGWSDGLPLVPPTEDRVESMLAGTGHRPEEVVAMLAPDLVPLTVEKVAINAVMAGCRPEYLPLVLAGCEAVASDQFNIHGVAATTQFVGPVLIVNGLIRRELGMNAGINALGPGNRANVTVGRAVNLVVRNVGGARPGEVDRSTLGSPAKLSLCFPEDEEGSPWIPLSVERSFATGQSTVTAFAGHGPHEIIDQKARSPERLADSFAAQLRSVGHPDLTSFLDAVLVVVPEHRRVFVEAGWDKARLAEELAQRLTFDGAKKFRPGGLWIVAAGGSAGSFSGILSGWPGGPRGSEMMTVSVDRWR
ncbi:MAG TPA: thioredoxin [Acidimicrobiia bacterium]|nr:thioredoxin [Acidimicrobiia bacterium]